MDAAKKILARLLEDIPENQIPEVIEFISFLKSKRDKETDKELLAASESSIDFWNNDIDDEVWNNV